MGEITKISFLKCDCQKFDLPIKIGLKQKLRFINKSNFDQYNIVAKNMAKVDLIHFFEDQFTGFAR